MIKTLKSIITVIMLLAMWSLMTYVFADLQIRRDILDSVAYIKKIVFTNNGMANWTNTIVIDWWSGNIFISWDINVWSWLCVWGVCQKSLSADSMWKLSWTNDIYYSTWNVNIGKNMVISWSLNYRWKNNSTELVLNGVPASYSCPATAIACVTYCLESSTSKIKWMKWLQPGQWYSECTTEWGDILHVVVHNW